MAGLAARWQLGVVMAFAAGQAACNALFSLEGISGAGGSDGGDDGATLDAPLDGAPGADAEAGATGDTGAGDATGTGDAASSEGAADAHPDTTAKDAPADVAHDAEAGPLTYAGEVLLDQPVGYWRLDDTGGGNPTAKDSSGHGVNGTYVGGVTHGVKGAIANDPDTAAGFDGLTGYVDIGLVFPFSGTATYTLEAWAAPTVDADYHGLVSRNDENGPPSEGFLMYIEPAPTPFYDLERLEPPSSKAIVESSYQATSGVWAHVVASFDGANMLLYVNGNQEDDQPAAFAITGATSHFVIGAQAGGSTAWFLGNLDEVAVYDKVLSATRIVAHYHVGIGLPP